MLTLRLADSDPLSWLGTFGQAGLVRPAKKARGSGDGNSRGLPPSEARLSRSPWCEQNRAICPPGSFFQPNLHKSNLAEDRARWAPAGSSRVAVVSGSVWGVSEGSFPSASVLCPSLPSPNGITDLFLSSYFNLLSQKLKDPRAGTSGKKTQLLN